MDGLDLGLRWYFLRRLCRLTTGCCLAENYNDTSAALPGGKPNQGAGDGEAPCPPLGAIVARIFLWPAISWAGHPGRARKDGRLSVVSFPERFRRAAR
jgi:hypothetical protein